MRIGLVVPHIFMNQAILPQVIFSPGRLAIDLAEGLTALGADVHLYTPAPVKTTVTNHTADLSLFEQELAARDDDYIDLLKKHPLTFITLARQVQNELIAQVYGDANNNQLDIVHIYTNEEEAALSFAKFCDKPIVFTHHDPFNFLIKYRSLFAKYSQLNWLSMSFAQRRGMPKQTNWVGNIYHGIQLDLFKPNHNPPANYIAYLGRIVEPKGLHLAIAAVQAYNRQFPNQPLQLRIAGKHYTGHKDTYWQEYIQPAIDNQTIIYEGYLDTTTQKQAFLGNAQALIIPSTFDEPFGMVMIEALACATPVIGLNSGAIPEVIGHKKTGLVVTKSNDESLTINRLVQAIGQIKNISRPACRQSFEQLFSLERMCREHWVVYKKLLTK